jgi:AcrR family transcriptional regulator
MLLVSAVGTAPKPARTGHCVAIQLRSRPDDTRGRIIETAEALFRRLGFAKTTVADIARELKMSPANVYRFFASKHAIVEAICERCLRELEEKAWQVARGRGSAAARLQRFILETIAYHKENLVIEQNVNEIVLVATEHSWQVIRAHKQTLLGIVEAILRDGIAKGELAAHDPRASAQLILRSLVVFTHPVLIAQCLREGVDVEADACASVEFLLRSLSPKA